MALLNVIPALGLMGKGFSYVHLVSCRRFPVGSLMDQSCLTLATVRGSVVYRSTRFVLFDLDTACQRSSVRALRCSSMEDDWKTPVNRGGIRQHVRPFSWLANEVNRCYECELQ